MPPVLSLAAWLAGCHSDSDGLGVPRDPVDEEVISAAGDVTWTVVFDDEAHAAGLADCSYTRTYDLAEDRSVPWLCVDCDLQLVGSTAMSEEDAACYRTLTGVDPATQERIGWSDGTLRRAILPFAPLVEAGTAIVTDATVDLASDSGPLDASTGGVTITSAGTLALGVAPGDPMHGLTPPITYECGWPAPDPPPYTGDYQLEQGEIVPDGLFLDACDEGFRLHDVKGAYAVIEISAADCAPCQTMASTADSGLVPLEEADIEIAVVTLLAPSLAAPLSPSEPALISAWNDTFEPHGPVVGDRGWGFAVAASQWGYEIVYPTWIVVSPKLQVLDYGQGFPGWDVIVDVIQDAER